MTHFPQRRIRMLRRVVGLLIVVLCSVSTVREASAHAFDPAVLALTEQGDGLVSVRLSHSLRGHEPGQPVDEGAPNVVMPPECERVGSVAEAIGESSRTIEWTLQCGDNGLRGLEVSAPSLSYLGGQMLVRYRPQDGVERARMLDTARTGWMLPTTWAAEHGQTVQGDAADVVRVYAIIGIEHILLGFDHLLFVLGLVLLIGRFRTLVATITAFTVAHSVTLALSVLGLVTTSGGPIETVIALSILLLAVELAREERGVSTLSGRWPWLVAFAFGLLHGFGFAGALAEIGLPAGEIPLALVSFNVGVEAGQIAFVGFVVIAQRLARALALGLPLVPLRWATIYVLGITATYWTLERFAGLVS